MISLQCLGICRLNADVMFALSTNSCARRFEMHIVIYDLIYEYIFLTTLLINDVRIHAKLAYRRFTNF